MERTKPALRIMILTDANGTELVTVLNFDGGADHVLITDANGIDWEAHRSQLT